jgi:hypothetical protein
LVVDDRAQCTSFVWASLLPGAGVYRREGRAAMAGGERFKTDLSIQRFGARRLCRGKGTDRRVARYIENGALVGADATATSGSRSAMTSWSCPMALAILCAEYAQSIPAPYRFLCYPLTHGNTEIKTWNIA